MWRFFANKRRQWSSTFAVPQHGQPSSGMSQSPEGSEVAAPPGIPDVQSIANTIPVQHISPQEYQPAPNGYVTPAMWQQSVASVYEGGLKRSWDYDQTA